jgi:hypothetical protein
MSYCACEYCGAVLDCDTVNGIHVQGACPRGCEGKIVPAPPRLRGRPGDAIDAQYIVQQGMSARVW